MKVHTDLETSLFIETEFNCVPWWPGTLCRPAGLQFGLFSCHSPQVLGLRACAIMSGQKLNLFHFHLLINWNIVVKICVLIFSVAQNKYITDFFEHI